MSTQPFASPYRTWQHVDLRPAWLLDPGIHFLNHGSFGARLCSVLDAQDALRREVERNPVQLMERERDGRIHASRQVAADFLGARVEDTAFVINATDATNAVVRSLVLEPSDELLTTTHVYNGVRQTLAEAAKRAGARYREIELPTVVGDPGEIAQRVIDGLGPRTRLLVLDHVSSPTALLFPVEAILPVARERGIEVFLDGAHAPGQIPVDLEHLASLGLTYSTGNFHKWPCAPLGTAYLWVHRDHQAGVRPTIISHFRGEGFTEEFRWQATRDLSSWLVLPEALRALESLVSGGWEAIRGHNRDLTRWGRALVLARLADRGVRSTAGSVELVGSMAAYLLPQGLRERFASPYAFHEHLMGTHRIEVPVNAVGADWIVRVSAHLHTHEDSLVAFADAVEAELDAV